MDNKEQGNNPLTNDFKQVNSKENMLKKQKEIDDILNATEQYNQESHSLQKLENSKKNEVLSDSEKHQQEAKQLLEETDKVNTQLSLFDMLSEIHIDSHNPNQAHKLYYNCLDDIIYSRAPRKSKAAIAIKEQLRLFLKKGKIKGADGRMASVETMKEAYLQVQEWVHNGEDNMALFNRFRDLNIAKGYI